MRKVTFHLPEEHVSDAIRALAEEYDFRVVYCSVCGKPLRWFEHHKSWSKHEVDEIAQFCQARYSKTHKHKTAPA